MSAPTGGNGIGAVAEGFETLRGAGGVVAILRRGLAPSLPAGILENPEGFLREHGRASGGRGAIARVASGAGPALLLKKYRHGGVLRAVLPDLFVGSGRMLGDLAASERARGHGVPCAAVAGLVLVRGGGPLWSGYLLTEEIADAVTLDRALGSFQEGSGEPLGTGGASVGRSSAKARHLAEIAVRTVRRLHDAGVLHRDLNLRNLLVRGEEVFVIDLDGARIAESPTAAQRFANLSRLDRSYVKIFREIGPLTHEDRRAILDLYCEGDAEMISAFDSRVSSHKRSIERHRRLWK
jgi:hypothetical protein